MLRSYSRFHLENGRTVRPLSSENSVPSSHAGSAPTSSLAMGRTLSKPTAPTFAKPMAPALGHRPSSAQIGGLRDITNLSSAGCGKGSGIVMLQARKSQFGVPFKTAALVDADGTHVEVAEKSDQLHEYVEDICQAWKREETLYLPSSVYMSEQAHITPKMRSILVDWLVDIHKKYKLRPETLFLAINLIDRYLVICHFVTRGTLQLVGVTAMLIASKYEERHPPKIKDYVYITDRLYTEKDILEMETKMLGALDFQLCAPTAVHFLDRYQSFNGQSGKHSHLSAFLLELALVDYAMLQYRPSLLAAAAIFVSNSLLQRSSPWTDILATQTEYDSHVLQGCSKDLRAQLRQCGQSRLQSVFKKFSQPAHHGIAQLACSLITDATHVERKGYIEAAELRRSPVSPMRHRGHIEAAELRMSPVSPMN